MDELIKALASMGPVGPRRDLQDLPDIPPEALVEAMVTHGANMAGLPMDMAYLAQAALDRAGVPNPYPLGEMRDVPMTSDWIAKKGGMDVDSPEYLMGSVLTPDAASSLKLQRLIEAMATMLPALGKGTKFYDEMADLVRRRPEPEDYDKTVTFIEADTVDPSVDARIKTTGQYRGAPAGLDSPQKLGSMRNELVRLLEVGSPGRQWYDESTKSIQDLVGGRRNLKHLAAGTHAITSRGAAVPSNRLFGVKGFNQALSGQPAKAGRFPNVQGEAIDELASGQPYIGGHKETPFYEGLTIDERGSIRPTNDLWMARAFGYKRKNPKTGELEDWGEGLGEAQHRFMDKEINRLVDYANSNKIDGHDDWTPERVQAAIWVGKKAEHEGTTVERALENFSHGLDDLTANIRWEATPAPGLEHMSGVTREPGYQELVETMVTNSQGQDRLALEMGMQTRPGVRGHGPWAGELNPSYASRVLAAPVTGGTDLDPASRGLIEAMAATRGMNLGQEAVGPSFLRTPKSATARNAARMDLGGPASGEQMLEAERLLNEQFGGGVIPLHSGRGMEFITATDDPLPVDFSQGIRAVGKEMGVKPEFASNAGRLVGNTEWSGFKPSTYMRTIDESGLGPESMARLERGAQREATLLEQMDDIIASNVPDAGKRSELIQRTRQILSTEGFDGIRRAVEAGILPAALLGVLATQQQQSEQPVGGPA